MATVSVIIPVYKVPLDFLRDCLNSLVAQAMQESEFILVSDGAPEAECSICKEFAHKDRRFKFFHKEHAGVSEARNHGINLAQGEYITFVDSDDLIGSTNLDEAYQFAKKNQSDIVFWDASLSNTKKSVSEFSSSSIPQLSEEHRIFCQKNILSASNLKYSCVSMVSCKLFKRDLLLSNNILYNTEIKICEDRLFNFKAFSRANKISYIHKVFYFYRPNTSSVTNVFLPNAFDEYTKFIKLLDSKERKAFNGDCSNMVVFAFFKSWQTCYMHKDNPEPFIKRMSQLKKISQSSFFKDALNELHYENFSSLLHLETLFLKLHFRLPMYLHGIKALLK